MDYWNKCSVRSHMKTGAIASRIQTLSRSMYRTYWEWENQCPLYKIDEVLEKFMSFLTGVLTRQLLVLPVFQRAKLLGSAFWPSCTFTNDWALYPDVPTLSYIIPLRCVCRIWYQCVDISALSAQVVSQFSQQILSCPFHLETNRLPQDWWSIFQNPIRFLFDSGFSREDEKQWCGAIVYPTHPRVFRLVGR